MASVSPETLTHNRSTSNAAAMLRSRPFESNDMDVELSSIDDETVLHPTRIIRHKESNTAAYQAFSINHHKSSFLNLSPSEYLNSVSDEETTFSFRQFIVDFIGHQFFPLSLPFFLMAEGTKSAKNRSFLPGAEGSRTFIFQVVVFSLWLSLLVVLWVEAPVDVQPIEIVILAMMFTSRNTIIALKYAYFSDVDLHQLRIEHNLGVMKKQTQRLILSWADPDVEFLQEELERAAKIAKTDLSIAHFHHHDKEAVDVNMHLAFELESNKKLKEKKRCTKYMNADLVALQLMKDGSRMATGRMKLAWVAGMGHAALPIIVKVIQGQPPFGFTPLGIVANVVNAVFGSLFFVNLVSFIVVGTIDFSRSSDVNRSLNHLITTGYKSGTHIKGMSKEELRKVKPIQLDLNVPENLVQWFRVRHVLKETGRLYRRRVLAYASFFFIYAIALLVYMFVVMITSPINDSHLLMFSWVSYDLVIVLICLLGLAIPAARNNQEEARQAANLSLHAVDVQAQLSEEALESTNELGHTKQLEQTLKLNRNILSAVEIDNKLRPAKVLGFEGSGLIRSLFTAVASVLVVIFNAVNRAQSNL
eukprot:TRINITY_DN2071_c0_g1_i1.p1 TRINITY_DN2071_c0_g1~~TRINITY_DN2071_c0_g1_i1.p1  ORF type:complete len:588 (-),score=169.71 TRINITY_DN2071_c0_g1_i1:62-1825(-)